MKQSSTNTDKLAKSTSFNYVHLKRRASPRLAPHRQSLSDDRCSTHSLALNLPNTTLSWHTLVVETLECRALPTCTSTITQRGNTSRQRVFATSGVAMESGITYGVPNLCGSHAFRAIATRPVTAARASVLFALLATAAEVLVAIPRRHPRRADACLVTASRVLARQVDDLRMSICDPFAAT